MKSELPTENSIIFEDFVTLIYWNCKSFICIFDTDHIVGDGQIAFLLKHNFLRNLCHSYILG